MNISDKMDNDLNIVVQNDRNLGVSKLTTAGFMKLKYICNKSPQENTILVLTEMGFEDAD